MWEELYCHLPAPLEVLWLMILSLGVDFQSFKIPFAQALGYLNVSLRIADVPCVLQS